MEAEEIQEAALNMSQYLKAGFIESSTYQK